MHNRGFSSQSQYRYGFNGKENDNEVKGIGNSLDFGARIYDPRLGRWLTCDPKASKYPDFSPYNYAVNSPILFLDEDGRDIGTTQQFADSRAGRVYDQLQSNSVFQKYSSPFKENSTTNLTFHYDPTSERGASGNSSTTLPTRSWRDMWTTERVESTINIFAKNFYSEKKIGDFTVIKKPSDIYIAKTLIHETIHSYLAVTGKGRSLTADQEHQLIAVEYRADIVKGLKEYAKENKITGLSNADFEAVSWAGLDGTAAYKKLPEATRKDYEIRIRNLSVQFTIENKVGDNKTSAKGNVPDKSTQNVMAHDPDTK